MENIVKRRRCVLSPQKGVDWASEMVLNPAIIRCPDTGRIHMLVRTSGPYSKKQIAGKPLPYPIFLAYGWSDDDGETFNFDFEKPALAPTLEYEKEKIYTTNDLGEKVVNYANGNIEDPRLFMVDGECYCTVACRMYPAGPYWEHDEPTQCMPDWALGDENPFSTQKNPTVTVLYKVSLKALSSQRYEDAFTYVTNLTAPEKGEDRDVVIFPEKMCIEGKMQYVMFQRPQNPDKYDEFSETRPSIVISAAEDLHSFANKATKRKLFYAPTESWQSNRVAVSTPPLSLENGEWLINFHAKQDDVSGYAQSFMLLKEVNNDFPEITCICKERWIVNEADFEKPSKFKIPCIFFTGMIQKGDNELLVSYGAADEFVGVMELDFEKLLKHLRTCKK